MRVILQKQVDKLGVPGDTVEVADGYARNYLLPRGLAVAASKGALRHVESLKRAHDVRTTKAKAEAEAVAARLAGAPIRVAAKV
ncbi:MAG TPA: 50S ribosomal protein L9, partial [Rubrobacteraceae bacterium]|nr:50S ribosomal protein L9 [Rubrobacteraceae bacterium]